MIALHQSIQTPCSVYDLRSYAARTYSHCPLLADDSGASTLEFAVALSLVLLCIFGIIVCSMALYADHFVTDAAKEATRYAMVRGSTWDGTSCSTYASFSCTATSANVTSFVDSLAHYGMSTAGLTTTTIWPGTTPSGSECDSADGNNSPSCIVNVQVQYSFNVLLPFVPFSTITLTGISSEVISQ